jgi:hypothetical protein
MLFKLFYRCQCRSNGRIKAVYISLRSSALGSDSTEIAFGPDWQTVSSRFISFHFVGSSKGTDLMWSEYALKKLLKSHRLTAAEH